MYIKTNVTITNTRSGPAMPVGATLADMHRLSGHPHAWRCRIAIAFYDASRKVSGLGDKVGCR